MSQYISIYAKHKDTPDEDKAICLFCRSRSFFHELDDYMPWTGDNPPTPLTKDSLSRIISQYTDEVLKPENHNLATYYAQLKDLGAAGICEGEVLMDTLSFIRSTQEEIDDINSILGSLKFVLSVMNDCTNSDFIYYYTNN